MSDAEYYTQIREWCKNDVHPPGLSEGQTLQFKKNIRNYEHDPETDILYFWMNGMRLKVILTVKKRFDLIQNAHINIRGHHLKENGILYRLATEFKVHWKDLKTDVDAYLQNKCSVCKENIRRTEEIDFDRSTNWKNVNYIDMGYMSKSSLVYLQLIMEVIGPLTVSNRGKRYICVLVDPESRWIEAESLESYDVKEIGEFVRKRCSSFGWCSIYCIGMSRKFMGRLNEEIREQAMEFEDLLWDMKGLFCTKGQYIQVDQAQADQAQAGGARLKSFIPPIKGALNRVPNDPHNIKMIFGIEFSNAMDLLIPAIHRHVSQYPKLWDRNLTAATSALRDKEWPDLGHTAFYAMFSSHYRKTNLADPNAKLVDVILEAVGAEDSPDELDYYYVDF